MTIQKPLKTLSTDGNVDKFGQFEDLDTLSSFKFSNDPAGKIHTTGTYISATFDSIDSSMTTIGAIVNPNKACFSAYRSGAITWKQDAAGKVEKFIIFENQVFDTTSSYYTVDGKFTAPISGLYYFQAQHCISDWLPNSHDERMAIVVNGVPVIYLYNASWYWGDYVYATGAYAPSYLQSHGNTMIHLTAGDYVQIKIYMDTYANTSSIYWRNSLVGRQYTFWQGYLAVKD